MPEKPNLKGTLTQEAPKLKGSLAGPEQVLESTEEFVSVGDIWRNRDMGRNFKVTHAGDVRGVFKVNLESQDGPEMKIVLDLPRLKDGSESGLWQKQES